MKFLHDCILLKDILVIGDLHIGYDERFGRSIGQVQLENILEKLEGIFKQIKDLGVRVKRVVLLGDVKHVFSGITDIEWRETLSLLDYIKVKSRGAKIIIIKGNHDNILEPIVKKRNINLRDYYFVSIEGKKYCFLHGDKMFEQCLDADWLLFGHWHPSITLSDNYKRERFKCFLKGKWERKNVIIFPSFSDIKYGSDLNNLRDENDKFSFIKYKDIIKFEVIIYNNDEKREYNFGKLSKLI
jgi:putative SbcD/Mre11-related phosphoesterase